MSLRDALIQALAVPFEDVTINGQVVRVKGLSAAQQIALANRAEGDGAAAVTFWMLEQVVCDPATGERLFMDDDAVLPTLDAGALTTLADVARRLSSAEERAKN